MVRFEEKWPEIPITTVSVLFDLLTNSVAASNNCVRAFHEMTERNSLRVSAGEAIDKVEHLDDFRDERPHLFVTCSKNMRM